MRPWLRSLPLVRAARALARRRERGALALYGAMAVAAAIALALPLSSGLSAELMASQHLRPTTMLSWAALQVQPKMYSFANTCWIGTVPLPAGPAGDARFGAESFWVNHYPARKARFDAERGSLAGDRRARFVYLRSSYRGHVETTAFVVRPEPRRLVIERREGP